MVRRDAVSVHAVNTCPKKTTHQRLIGGSTSNPSPPKSDLGSKLMGLRLKALVGAIQKLAPSAPSNRARTRTVHMASQNLPGLNFIGWSLAIILLVRC